MKKQLTALVLSALMILISVYTAQALQVTFNPSAINVTSNSALVEWQTDEDANSSLTYWNVQDNITATFSEANLSMNHSYLLGGLNASTSYKYWFSSSTSNETIIRNNSGNFYEFTTLNLTAVPMFLNVTIPSDYFSTRITFSGTTVPGALVHGYANPEEGEVGLSFYDRETFADENGSFTIYNLALDGSREENTVTVWARDSSGNTNTTSAAVHLDLIPPNVTILIPAKTKTGDIKINGTTDENITVEIYAGAYENNTAPVLNESNLVSNQTVTAASITPFSFTVSMPGDKNLVLVQARDRGGNLVTEEQTVVSDTIPPVFEAPASLDALSPTYLLDVEITGKLSEPGQVTAIVNGKTQDTVKTDKDGSYSITATLEKAVVSRVNASSFDISYGSFINQTYIDTYPNFVTLVAKDDVGNSAEISGSITYTPCGFGTWWNVNKGEGAYIMPSVLPPQMLLDGNAQVSLSFRLDWQGFGNYNLVRPDVKIIPLNIQAADNYDLKWISGISTSVSQDGRSGYALIGLRAPDPTPPGENWTYQQKLANISRNRAPTSIFSKSPLTASGASLQFSEQYSCKTMPPGVGCVKLPLMFEIYFESDQYNGTQKICNYVEVSIDQSLFNLEKIPNDYLENMIKFMDNIIANIEPVIKFVQDTEKVLAITYAGSIVAFFGYKFNEFYSCRFSKVLGEGFTIEDAMQNCYVDDAITGTTIADHPEVKNPAACAACANAMKNTKEFQIWQNWIGDRLLMPSVPTLQHYIDENWNNEYSWCYSKGLGQQGDSAYLTQEDYVKIANAVKSNGGQQPLYDEGKCGILHPSTTADNRDKNLLCCGIEYQRQWRSACALLDPLQESACYANQANVAIGGPNLLESSEIGSGVKCHPAWNSVAGFCDAQGGFVPELSNTNLVWTDPFVQATSQDHRLSFIIVPETDAGASPLLSRLGGGADVSGAYYVAPGYFGLEHNIQLKQKEEKNAGETVTNLPSKGKNLADWNKGMAYQFSSDMTFYPYDPIIGSLGTTELNWIDKELFDPSIDCWDCIGGNRQTTTSRGISVPSPPVTGLAGRGCSAFEAFNNKLVELKDNGFILSSKPITEADSCSIYNDIRSKMGIQDKDYIVEPSTAGLLRSMQCMALPSIATYLAHWKTIFSLVKQCFEITLTTGDSNPTVCREALSMQICDTVYEAIKCFTNKFSLGYNRKDDLFGFGRIIGAMTSAGAGVANDLQSRYGGDAIFQSIFGEQRLINAICIWAFTGEWIMDFNSIFEADYQVPINSTVIVMPAERRFVSANPLTIPSGQATYNYKIGLALVAGSDLTFNVKLICSNDYSCSPTDGYENGMCDCVKGNNGQQATRLFPFRTQNSLSAGESLGTGGRGAVEYDQFESRWRYDKVKVEWKWKSSPQGETKTDSITVPIKEVGGKPPVVCEWDDSFASFLCNLGFGDEGLAVLQDVVPEKSPAYLNDNVRMRVTINQQLPEGAERYCSGVQYCNQTKYLDVSIISKDGQTLCRENPMMIPAATGPTTVYFPKNCVVSGNWFRGVTGGSWDHASFGIGDIPLHDISISNILLGTRTYIIVAAKKGNEIRYYKCGIAADEFAQLYVTPNECKEVSIDQNSQVNIDGAILRVSTPSTIPCNEANAALYGKTTRTKTGEEINLCDLPSVNDSSPETIAAVKLQLMNTGGAVPTLEQQVDYRVELRNIYIRNDQQTGIQDIRNDPAEITIANGVPQRKTGTISIVNQQREGTGGEAGTSPPAISAPTISSVDYKNGKFIITMSKRIYSSDLQTVSILLVVEGSKNSIVHPRMEGIATFSGTLHYPAPTSNIKAAYFSSDPNPGLKETAVAYKYKCEFSNDNWACSPTASA